MNFFRSLIDKLLRFEDLSPMKDRSYLLRWILFSWGTRRIYLHKVLNSDWSREPHNHPKTFWSIGLKGEYVEEIYEVKFNGGDPRMFCVEERLYRAPWIRSFGTDLVHRLRSTGKPCWTLVFTGKATRDWGFFEDDGTFVPYPEYMRRLYGETYPS